jgi:hypothetical protein
MEKTQFIKIAAGGALAISFIGNGLLLNRSMNLSENNDRNILKADSLMAVNAEIEKSLNKTRHELTETEIKNIDLENMISEAKEGLADTNNKIELLSKENASIPSLRKELSSLKKQKADWEKKIKEYSFEKDRLMHENNSLATSINTLKKENSTLSQRLDIATVYGNSIFADNIKVENFRVKKSKKSRQTIKARRVNQMNVNFTLLENPFIQQGSKKINLIITDPENIILNQQVDNFMIVESNQESKYSYSSKVDYKGSRHNVSTKFEWSDKLKKGIYRMEIYVDGKYSGKYEFNLI